MPTPHLITLAVIAIPGCTAPRIYHADARSKSLALYTSPPIILCKYPSGGAGAGNEAPACNSRSAECDVDIDAIRPIAMRRNAGVAR